MKKLLLITISAIIINILLSSQLVLAGDKGVNTACKIDSECTKGLLCYPRDADGLKICTDALDVLTGKASKDKTPTGNITLLPNISIEQGISTAIKAILRAAMLLTIAAISVAAMYYLTSRGKEEDITKAKDIILYLIIGMAIMAAAYGIVAGITKFNVFE